MKKVFLCFIIVCSSWSYAKDQAILVSLPLAARQALTQWNFKFTPFEVSDYTPEVRELLKDRLPMEVSGDFNGDNINDYALVGEAEKQQYVIALVSDKKTFKTVVVQKWSEANFKKSSVPGGKGELRGVPVYLTKASGELAEQYKKVNRAEPIGIEAYLGSVQIFGIKDFKAIKLE